VREKIYIYNDAKRNFFSFYLQYNSKARNLFNYGAKNDDTSVTSEVSYDNSINDDDTLSDSTIQDELTELTNIENSYHKSLNDNDEKYHTLVKIENVS